METMKIKIVLVLMISICMVTTGKAQDTIKNSEMDFQYLTVDSGVVRSIHKIKHSLHIPRGFNTTQILRHKPIFNEHPFNVSAIGVHNRDIIIMVHAEAITDSSGYLNYSYMDSTQLDGIKFYASDENCITITDDLLSNAIDLQFFQERGVNFFPAIYMKQYFQNSEDGNYEYVLSYAKRVADCSESTITKSFKKNFKKQLKKTIELED